MSENRFADLGRIEAIQKLYEGTPFTNRQDCWFETFDKEIVTTASRVLLEGIDFDLVYFPLKHLGYKSVVAVTGELYAQMSAPKCLNAVFGVSAKLDFDHIHALWEGLVSAAREHGYQDVALDLIPSRNGLTISLTATGTTSHASAAHRSAAHTKDLICVSGSLGAAYLGLRKLESEKKFFEQGGEVQLDAYKMLVAAYLKPELQSGIPALFEEAGVYPSYGYFVTRGLADAVKRLARDSGFGAKIYADKIPFEGNSFQLGRELDIDPVSAAMNGGDDLRLLFVIPILSLEAFRRDFQSFDIIGHLALPEAGTVLVTPEGVELPLRAQGWHEED